MTTNGLKTDIVINIKKMAVKYFWKSVVLFSLYAVKNSVQQAKKKVRARDIIKIKFEFIFFPKIH